MKHIRKNGFTLVELMVVIAIVALLAAIALPMYSTFKQKNRVGSVVTGVAGAMRGLQAYYEHEASFSGITVDPVGGALRSGTQRVGVGLPRVPNVTYTISDQAQNSLRINWAFSSGCPALVCNGYYEINCDPIDSFCDFTVLLDSDNTLGFNQ